MVVAEIILSSFITVLFEKLASGDLIKLARSAGIYSELDKWKITLTQIQAVLADAGQKHIAQIAVQQWLHSLHHLAYDIDDLLDDLATEAMRRQLNKGSDATSSTNKVLKIIPSTFTPRNIIYGRKMSSKLDDITTRLHQLVQQKKILLLVENVERSTSTRTNRRLEETSLVDKSRIVGREKDKEALLSKLLDLEDESTNPNFSVVSIVGFGGIGKTTLAQALYNDKKVEDCFQLKAWVCVSDEFDVFNISKAIFQAVGGGGQSFANLNMLQVALKEKLLKKRFLLVLDDVWNENYDEWELLQRPFAVGAPGSKVIVTTRNTIVTTVMDSVQPYPLEVLSNEASLSLFAQHALGEPNFDKHPTLKLHGEGIIKKCDGLPLALRTLGRVLRTKTNADEWEDLLNDAIWNLHNEGKILPALRLSYYDLPSHLKQLFAYCCLFPKDYVFNKDELVLLWMAEGFLHESNANKTMESFGREYFEELVSRSFFQHSTEAISRYVMHDLVNDLAMSVGGEFFFRLDDKVGSEALEKVHHFSYISQEYGKYKKFKVLQRARRLRTFLSVKTYQWQRFYLSNKVLHELVPQIPFLRVLNLSEHSITEVPQSIGSLKHIRYINFSHTDIICLPDQVSDLYNLQSLLLRGCHNLSSLPDSFAKLINLRHLDIRDTPELNKIPSGIGRLTSLQTLSKVIIEGANGFKISELKVLSHLRGQVYVKGLHNVRDGIEAKEADLQQKKDLDDLVMEWRDDFDDSRDRKNEYEVLEGLRPNHKLKNLNILFYGGMKFPGWVGDSSFNQLTELRLRGCRSCTYLPTLGHLQSLRKLFVSSMNEVKTLGIEFLASTNSFDGIAFPSLEVLEFDDMQGWERWSTSGGGKDIPATLFPCLRNISIKNCTKLNEVSIDLIPSLRVLYIKGCSEEVLRSMVGVSSSIVTLSMEDITGLTQLHEDVLKHLGEVEHLYIDSCNELKYLWECESEAWNFLVSLKELTVEGCEMLVSLGKTEDLLAMNLTSLKKVTLFGCKRLERYKCPYGVESLMMWKCGSITSLTFPTTHDLSSTLKNIYIINCCEKLEESWLLNNYLSSLKSLIMQSNMSLFPEGCFVYLTQLHILNCDRIESIPEKGFGFLPLFCLKSLHITRCKNLKSFPHVHLPSLTSLEELVIKDCPSLDDSFPCGLWPPNLRTLKIGCLNKPMSEWGLLQNFPSSLVELHLYGQNSGVVSFAEADGVRNNTTSSSFLLPPSLTSLYIYHFEELESVSKGLQHLTCLEYLSIKSCPKLRDLPDKLLPSLSYLNVEDCKKLEKRCQSRTGKYWPIISQIPCVWLG